MLIDWINDVLVGERIIVKDLAEDLYDGQVLQKLFGEKLDQTPKMNTNTAAINLVDSFLSFRHQCVTHTEHQVSLLVIKFNPFFVLLGVLFSRKA